MQAVGLTRAVRQIPAAVLRDKLARIRLPTLVVWGENDRLIPVAVGQRLSASLPNSAFRVIQGAGHNPMWDRAAAFNQAAVRFLTQSDIVDSVSERSL